MNMPSQCEYKFTLTGLRHLDYLTPLQFELAFGLAQNRHIPVVVYYSGYYRSQLIMVQRKG